MATTNYNFTTISGTDAIDIVSAINTPLTEIDALESQMKKMKKGTTYDDIKTNGFVYQSEA